MEVFVATVLGLAGLVVVVVALQRDAVVDMPAPAAPNWDPLPTRSEVARTEFPLRVPGYDPASVELAFDALADAYADLLAEADSATIERARRRASARLGRDDPRSEAPGADIDEDGERGEPRGATAITALDAAIPAADAPEQRPQPDRPKPSVDAATHDALREVVALEALRDSRER